MRLTKLQIKILDQLQDGAWIWQAAGHPYLAQIDREGRVRSINLNNKTFTTMRDNGLIIYDEATKRWRSAV